MEGWFRFPDQVDSTPTTEGVYLLADVSADGIDHSVYVGRADNLRERLESHPDPANPCLQRKQIRYFAYEENSDSENRERQLIDQINPECNRI